VKIIKLTFPFSLLAIFFITISLILNDKSQLYFGLVWLIITVIAYVFKRFIKKLE